MKPNGERETWDETVRRTVKGNLSLVPRERTEPGEEEKLYDLIYNFRVIPGGRHLWMSGVEGRQFLFNCYVSGWGDHLYDHFSFTFLRLMEGGGVGTNYSSKHLAGYKVNNLVRVLLTCSEEHPDFKELSDSGLLSPDHLRDDAYVIPDSREGWAFALSWIIREASMMDDQLSTKTIVFDLSQVRAKGLPIKTFGGTSAGPVPLARLLLRTAEIMRDMWQDGVIPPLAMDLDQAISECVVSGNVRRSARMSLMHWSDPYIEWFLKCKEDGSKHWSTNISVEIDDEFIYALKGESGNPGKDDYASKVYDLIIKGMLKNGEPGIWNSDLSNQGEPNRLLATNPCGEIALEAWENCNLGHINLDKFILDDGSLDYDGVAEAHRLITRFLIRATFADINDPKTSDVVYRNRRIGVGHFGFAGFVAKQGIRFSDSHKSLKIRQFLAESKHIVSETAREYAHLLRIPVPVKTTTIAPTGTIAKLPGASEGIHPVFARHFIRRIRYSTVDPQQASKIESFIAEGRNVVPDPNSANTVVVEIPMEEPLVQELVSRGINPEILESVDEISLSDMLSVQSMYQTLWADNAVSFTVNFDPDVTPDWYLAQTIIRYLPRLKGTTLFPERGYELPPYERVTQEQYEALRGSQAVLGQSYDEACASGACPVR